MVLNPFFLTAGLYVIVGLLATVGVALDNIPGIPGISGLLWLRTHLITVGIVVQVVFGFAPSLARRNSGTGNGSAAVFVIAEWVLLNSGFILLLIGIPAGDSVISATGALLIMASLGVLAADLLQGKKLPDGDTRFYLSAAGFFSVGILLALSLLLNWPAPGGRLGVLEAHMHANMWGFVAMATAGALLQIVPGLTNRTLYKPHLVTPTYWLMTAGNIMLIAGPWLGVMLFNGAGLILFMIGVVLFLTILFRSVTTHRSAFGGHLAGPSSSHRSALLGQLVGPYSSHRSALLGQLVGAYSSHRSALLGQLVGAYFWMLIPLVFFPVFLLAPELLTMGRVKTATVEGLVYGWLLQLAMVLMPMALMKRPGEPELSVTSRLWPRVLLTNAGVLAIWATDLMADPPLLLVLTGYGCLVLGWIGFARETWGGLRRALADRNV